MSLTDYTEDSSDNDGGVECPEVNLESVDAEKEDEDRKSAADLNVSNLEQHNKNMGDAAKHEFSNSRGSECESEARTQVGAGLFFGLSGLLLGGPLLGVLTGAGAAIVASKDKGPAGDVARATGEFAVVTGSKVGEAAKEVNEKHSVLEKIKNALTSAWSMFQKFDEEHKISEKTKETMSDVSQKTVEFENKHHVMENILEGIQNGVNFMLVKLKDVTSRESGTSRDNNTKNGRS